MKSINVKSILDTFRRLFGYNAFLCSGPVVHITLGTLLRKSVKGYTCPECGADVKDITDTLLGRTYLDFVRPELGNQS